MEESLLLEVGHGGRHLYMMVLSNKALNGLHYAPRLTKKKKKDKKKVRAAFL